MTPATGSAAPRASPALAGRSGCVRPADPEQRLGRVLLLAAPRNPGVNASGYARLGRAIRSTKDRSENMNACCSGAPAGAQCSRPREPGSRNAQCAGVRAARAQDLDLDSGANPGPGSTLSREPWSQPGALLTGSRAPLVTRCRVGPTHQRERRRDSKTKGTKTKTRKPLMHTHTHQTDSHK